MVSPTCRGKAAVKPAGGFAHDSMCGAGCGDGGYFWLSVVCGAPHARLLPADHCALHPCPHQLLSPLQVVFILVSGDILPGPTIAGHPVQGPAAALLLTAVDCALKSTTCPTLRGALQGNESGTLLSGALLRGRTAATDPGFLPRPGEDLPAWHSEPDKHPRLGLGPCTTCRIDRPLRSKHCVVCNRYKHWTLWPYPWCW